MPTVHLGNTNAIDSKTLEPLGEQITTSHIPDDWPLEHQVLSITHPGGSWVKHSTDGRPAWVESPDSPELAAAVAEAFGGIPVGRPVAGVEPEPEADEPVPAAEAVAEPVAAVVVEAAPVAVVPNAALTAAFAAPIPAVAPPAPVVAPGAVVQAPTTED